jgi:hypothetical protein
MPESLPLRVGLLMAATPGVVAAHADNGRNVGRAAIPQMCTVLREHYEHNYEYEYGFLPDTVRDQYSHSAWPAKLP